MSVDALYAIVVETPEGERLTPGSAGTSGELDEAARHNWQLYASFSGMTVKRVRYERVETVETFTPNP